MTVIQWTLIVVLHRLIPGSLMAYLFHPHAPLSRYVSWGSSVEALAGNPAGFVTLATLAVGSDEPLDGRAASVTTLMTVRDARPMQLEQRWDDEADH